MSDPKKVGKEKRKKKEGYRDERKREGGKASVEELCPDLPAELMLDNGQIITFSACKANNLSGRAKDALMDLCWSNITPIAEGTSMRYTEADKRQELFEPSTRFLILTISQLPTFPLPPTPPYPSDPHSSTNPPSSRPDPTFQMPGALPPTSEYQFPPRPSPKPPIDPATSQQDIISDKPSETSTVSPPQPLDEVDPAFVTPEMKQQSTFTSMETPENERDDFMSDTYDPIETPNGTSTLNGYKTLQTPDTRHKGRTKFKVEVEMDFGKEELIGFCSWRFDTEETLSEMDAEVVYLKRYELHTAPQHRRQGLGRLLLSRLEEIGGEREMDKVMLTVLKRGLIGL
ncbi:hypothetical protein TREMEDRAFT_59640 [Tremella mesenterica DSM 1558]|uniref:uncharacterized protein n=1 Tax=Tremella mesenterica (strain ATCC 24925 / CBS 8224 / DSM 1558 / NBRC 9311 / NRRL Y-6157 / RJB 2259-6 / UBC 559-6) TaxID=578456 RepID=UPI0003F49944|nr:uncharacterized protein TREMEDRAFT_59640 [Tremella mesenterica DSM 1558]EIW73470.1 hypothetical protein TREMEDRAFT_59640 [Tremella mesenterica DSM 1558]